MILDGVGWAEVTVSVGKLSPSVQATAQGSGGALQRTAPSTHQSPGFSGKQVGADRSSFPVLSAKVRADLLSTGTPSPRPSLLPMLPSACF